MPGTDAMRISVIIPARNEEAVIGPALSRLRRTSTRRRTEIIVADGASTDHTAHIAGVYADKVLKLGHAGRASQMQQGALAASGDILLFLHADTRLPRNWERDILEAWSAPEKPSATAFRLRFDSDKPVYRMIAAAANWRAGLTGVPHGDQGIAVERNAFLHAGGFPPVPIMEEYLLIKKLRGNASVLILPRAATTSVRRYEKNGPLINALRNAALIALFHVGVPPRRLARLYK